MTVTPLLLFVGCPSPERDAMRHDLAPCDWRFADAEDGESAAAVVAASPVSLALIRIARDSADRSAFVRKIRAGMAGGARVPMLAIVAERDGDLAAAAREAGLDGVVVRPGPAEALIAAVRPWHPVEVALDRLGAVFGETRVAALLGDFRRQLERALDRLEAGDRGLAHRIGGLAGTLGFAAVSAGWLAVSEGDDSAAADARESSRAALETIDRRLPSH